MPERVETQQDADVVEKVNQDQQEEQPDEEDDVINKEILEKVKKEEETRMAKDVRIMKANLPRDRCKICTLKKPCKHSSNQSHL